jgi:glycosyltransferase involved in cell wall biosynthesis
VRILYVTRYWPHNAAIGSEVRAHNVLRALQHIGTVEVVMLDDGTEPDPIPATHREFNVAYALEVTERPNKGLTEKLRWTLDPTRPYPYGCGVDNEAMRRVVRSLKEFDLIWFFKLRSPDMFPGGAWPCSVVDIDDVPSTYERATMHVDSGVRERLSARRRVFAWRRRERLLGDRFTVLAVCSEEDSRYLRNLGVKAPIHVIPNGFDRPSLEPVRRPAAPPRVGFIGTFDYFPNSEGIHWFVNKCWQRIKQEVPDVRLRLVGRGSDGPLKPVGPEIDGLGWLANPSDEIRTWSVMVVPIRVGAGTRVKIAQGFSDKCPIVSTTLGANGYGAVDGNEMFLADSAEAFSDDCIKVIRQPERAAQMAERAWRHFLEKWTWDTICPLVWTAAEDCLQRAAEV